MTNEEMLAMVEKLYAAAGQGDFDAAEEMLTDDLVIREAAGLPFEGTFTGRTALRELSAKVFGMMEIASLERVATTVGGDHAVAIAAFHFADPQLKPAELCEMFRFRDGKVCEIKPYYFEPQTVVDACEAFARKKA
ncbi:MAG: nuclear transport factor 2 family protein [Pseudomonadota bacterium]